MLYLEIPNVIFTTTIEFGLKLCSYKSLDGLKHMCAFYYMDILITK